MAQTTTSRTKSKEVYNKLKSDLHSGVFEHGERLTEVGVAERLGTGRGPVREALQRLEAEGLLVGRGAYRGKYVKYIEDQDKQEVIELYELREAIEGQAARLAAMNMTGWQVRELQELNDRLALCYRSEDIEAAGEVSVGFHRYLVANCGNSRLLTIWESSMLAPLHTRSAFLESKIMGNVADKVSDDHELLPVVEAIARRDAESAERSMKEVIRRITDAIRKTDWNRTGVIESNAQE